MTDDPTAVTPVVTDPQPTASTPEPVIKAAAIWGSLSALIVTGLGVLVAVGTLSSEQAAVVNQVVNYVTVNLVPVGSVIVGLVGLLSGLVSSHVTALVARRHVTPVPPARVR